MEGIDHLDLVVSDLERSLRFSTELLRSLGFVRQNDIEGERGERVVDERAAWLRAEGHTIESGPEESAYSPGCYAVFFHDPDGIKLEIVRWPREEDLAVRVAELEARLARLEDGGRT